MKQSFLKGAFFITAATFLSKVLGSLFRIPLQNIAGDEVLGIFTLVFPIYMVILTLSVAGIPLAISKLISEALAKNELNSITNIYRTSAVLTFSFGLIGFIFLNVFSVPLSAVLGGRSSLWSIIMVSFTLLVAPYMSVYRGFFQGFNDMRPTAFSQVIEQFVRVAFILILAYVFVNKGFPSSKIAAGVMGSSVIGALSSLVYLRWHYTRFIGKRSEFGEKRYTYDFQQFKSGAIKILRLSIPIAVGSLMMALLNLVDSLSIPTALKVYGLSHINDWYGVYGRGLALVQIATVFSTSLVLPMVPAISASIARKNHAKNIQLIEKARGLNVLISWPTAIGVICLAMPLNMALFGDLRGSSVIALLGFTSFFNAVAVLDTGILAGMNLQIQSAKVILLAAVLKVALNFLFVSVWGLIGAALSTLIIFCLISFFSLYLIRGKYPVSMLTKSKIIYIGAGLVMGMVVGIPTYYFHVAAWSRMFSLVYVLLTAFVGAGVYLGIILIFMGADQLRKLPLIGAMFEKVVGK
jgi:O-antigen/teichoic acid export membrane protein